MPKLFDPKVDIDVRRLSIENYTQVQIKKKLKEEDVHVSLSTICRILKNVGISRQAYTENKQPPKYRRPPIKRIPGTVRKIATMVTKENPTSHRAIQKKTGLSLDTINKVIHKDLKLVSRKKGRVHKLSDKNKKNRKTNCRKLYEKHLAGDKWKYAVTLDEALIYLDETNGKKEICYVDTTETVPESWIFEKSESFQKSFMVVGVITGKRTLPLMRVPSNTKINAQYYVDYVLKPLFTEYLPRLYRKEMNKVFFHHDKCTSHTAKITTEFLEKQRKEQGISYILPQDIPVKSPDASPLDFFGFGYLKQTLASKRPKTLDGVWKLSQEVWSKIKKKTIGKVFGSWKKRLRLISTKDGQQIEHIKAIHSKKIS
jgi:transposase